MVSLNIAESFIKDEYDKINNNSIETKQKESKEYIMNGG